MNYFTIQPQNQTPASQPASRAKPTSSKAHMPPRSTVLHMGLTAILAAMCMFIITATVQIAAAGNAQAPTPTAKTAYTARLHRIPLAAGREEGMNERPAHRHAENIYRAVQPVSPATTKRP